MYGSLSTFKGSRFQQYIMHLPSKSMEYSKMSNNNTQGFGRYLPLLISITLFAFGTYDGIIKGNGQSYLLVLMALSAIFASIGLLLHKLQKYFNILAMLAITSTCILLYIQKGNNLILVLGIVLFAVSIMKFLQKQKIEG